MSPLATRHFLVLFFISIFVSQNVMSQGLTRRQFITSTGACAALLVADFKAQAHDTWSIDPSLNLDRMGLESFGLSIRNLLVTKNMVSNPEAEKIRWNIQQLIWNQLKAKTQIKMAILLDDKKYLYLRPTFLTEFTDTQSIHKIIYVSENEDPRIISYWISDLPPTDAVIVNL